MSQPDRNLKAALVRWRRETALQTLGPALVRSYGAKVFVSDQIVERLVVCAHAFKLAGVDDIVRETGWRKDRAEEHGNAILKVIHAHIPLPSTAPPPVFSEVPLTGGIDDASRTVQANPDAGPTTRKSRRPAKCSKCHQEGHISSNRSCPARIANRTYDNTHTAVSNENAAPRSIDESIGVPVPPQRSYYRHTTHTLYTPPVSTMHVPSDVPLAGPSNILLVSTSHGNHYAPVSLANPANPALYPDGTPIH